MSNRRTCIALLRAFKEITQSLIGLMRLYDCDPQLVQDTACTLREVFRTHFERNESNPKSEEEEALHDLLKEIETTEEEMETGA